MLERVVGSGGRIRLAHTPNAPPSFRRTRRVTCFSYAVAEPPIGADHDYWQRRYRHMNVTSSTIAQINLHQQSSLQINFSNMAPTYLKNRAIKGDAVSTIQSNDHVSQIVKGVIDHIRHDGDTAVRHYSEKFDKWSPPSFKLSQSDIDEILSQVPDQVIKDIKTVQANVRKFAEAQKNSLSELELEIEPGVFLGHKNVPIQNVGA